MIAKRTISANTGITTQSFDFVFGIESLFLSASHCPNDDDFVVVGIVVGDVASVVVVGTCADGDDDVDDDDINDVVAVVVVVVCLFHRSPQPSACRCIQSNCWLVEESLLH